MKHQQGLPRMFQREVALRRRAWIETFACLTEAAKAEVALRRRAWIETAQD